MTKATQYVVCLGVHRGRVLAFYKDDGPEGARGLNGPGGEVEKGESVAQAASREWSEEVLGLPPIAVGGWREVGRRAWAPAEDLPAQEPGPWDHGGEVVFLAAGVPAPDVTLLVCGRPATFLDPAAKWHFSAAWDFRENAQRAVLVFAGYIDGSAGRLYAVPPAGSTSEPEERHTEPVAQAIAVARREGEIAGWRARGEVDVSVIGLAVHPRNGDAFTPQECRGLIRALPDEPPDLGGKERP